MQITLTEDQFGRLQEALNTALGVAILHAPRTKPRLMEITNELDDAWNDQNIPDETPA